MSQQPRKSPAQERLFNNRYSLWFLLQKKNHTKAQLANLFGVSRMSLYRFLYGEDFQKLDFSINGERVLEEVKKVYPQMDLDKLIQANRVGREEVDSILHKKYLHLF